MSDFAREKRRSLLMEAALLDLTKVDWSVLDLTECINERDKIAAKSQRRDKRPPKPNGDTEGASG